MTRLLNELRRRSVFRVGAAYLVVAWLLIQLAALLESSLGLPDWFDAVAIGFIAIGLPVALVLAWAFEVTPEGFRKTEPAKSDTGFQKPGITDFAIIALLVIVLGATGFQVMSRDSDGQTDVATATSDGNTSIAVLPFVNMSGEDTQEYFSDGMTEEIINALVRVPDLAVAARTSVFAFKGTNEDIRSIGAQLGVSHVLEGSVRMTEGSLRVTAQLIDVETGFHLWSENYDRPQENIFTVQEAIADAIADRLIDGFVDEDTVPNRTENIDAYDHFLRGSSALRQRDLNNARASFERALDADPEFAPAWASLAIALQIMDEDDDAIDAANRALELDPESVHAMTALASVYRTQRNWLEAESIFRRAMALDSGSSELIEDYSEFMYYVGKFERALELSARGYELDPYMVPLASAHVSVLLASDMPEEAATVINRSLPNSLNASSYLFTARVLQGDHEQADNILNEMRAAAVAGMESEDNPAFLPFWQAGLDLLDDYQREFNGEGDDASRERIRAAIIDNPPYFPNDLLWLLGMKIGMESTVMDALSDHGGDPSRVNNGYLWEPYLQPLRNAPEYNEMIELVGLPDYWRIAGWPDQCRPVGTDDFTCVVQAAE
jgi:TolB-like protein/Tfp pilus assembly protein PilF